MSNNEPSNLDNEIVTAEFDKDSMSLICSETNNQKSFIIYLKKISKEELLPLRKSHEKIIVVTKGNDQIWYALLEEKNIVIKNLKTHLCANCSAGYINQCKKIRDQVKILENYDGFCQGVQTVLERSDKEICIITECANHVPITEKREHKLRIMKRREIYDALHDSFYDGTLDSYKSFL